MKHVRLPDFCYACGMLSYAYKRCDLYDSNVLETELQYGAASLVKKKTKELEKEIQQQSQCLLKLQSNNSNNRASVRLKFEKDSASLMNIDQIPITISKDLTKRKIGGLSFEQSKKRMFKTTHLRKRQRLHCNPAEPNECPMPQLLRSWQAPSSRHLRCIFRRFKPNLVFLSETELSTLEIKRFMGIYGLPKAHNKLKTCKLLLDPKSHSDLSGLLGETRRPYEAPSYFGCFLRCTGHIWASRGISSLGGTAKKMMIL
ncbi:LOW QUALITY PROTEIN: hypothetical protein Cgig2_027273 [Carnegiea gigantea]|uniref:Uncharacterized protein n=1 Tax=Carnegiea gigantea TaxID=171969 RepID=A0A9Q1Q3S3_9CARY|nr:LOW QUALITY PROTEIN: hypothetical protein Cgig2_027273 [Carnegiea gigantea]